MGIIYSLLGWTSAQEEPDPVTGLTPHEVQLIKTSWANATKDRTQLGVNIMLMLFKKHPEYKNYFPFKNVPDDELKDNIKFKVHCTTVIYSLGQIVDNLENGELVRGMLEKLADNHIRHEAPAEGFVDIQEVLLAALEPLEPDTTKAWKKFLLKWLTIVETTLRIEETRRMRQFMHDIAVQYPHMFYPPYSMPYRHTPALKSQ